MYERSGPSSTKTSYFLCKIIPMRVTFGMRMTRADITTLAQHYRYWQNLMKAGTVVVFGPVADPEGAWALLIVKAPEEKDARALCAEDPAVKSGTVTFKVYAMPSALVFAPEQ